MTATPAPTDLLLRDLQERPWAAYAACRRADPDLFFPGPEGTPDAAVRICRGCPVLAECRDWALGTKVRYGVWGAMTERERRRTLRKSA